MDSTWINTVDSQGSTATSSEALHLPKRINLHDSGLCRSPYLKEKSATSGNKRKAHVNFGATITKVISLFTLFSNVKDLAPCMPLYKLNPNASFTTREMHRFHELNDLYDGTVNKIHHLAFLSMNVASNEVFTYQKVMKEADAELLIAAIQKEISYHESHNHWTIIHRSTLPLSKKTIQAIWSFKRKRFPDGRLNKHKARICAHRGIQEWGEN